MLSRTATRPETPEPGCTSHPCSMQPETLLGKGGEDKSRVSKLLQGLAFSHDSEAGEDNEPEVQPERKKLKVSSVPRKS